MKAAWMDIRRSGTRRRNWLAAVALLLALALNAAASPDAINYQGRLTDNAGQPITTTQTLTFTFWDNDAGQPGASQLGGAWSDTKQVRPDSNGFCTAFVGSDPENAIPADVFTTDSVWLNVRVGSTDLVPRTRVTSVAFVARADYATSTALAAHATQAMQAARAYNVPGSGSMDASALTSGTLSDARISTSMARYADVDSSAIAFQGFRWFEVTGDCTLQRNCGYIVNSPTLVTLSLPLSLDVGLFDTIRVYGRGAGGYRILRQDVYWNETFMPYTVDVLQGTWGSSSSGAAALEDIAGSADCSRLVACANPGWIYTSANYGGSWTPRCSNTSWTGVASSADGTHIIACVNGGYLYLSPDCGVSWTARMTDTGRAWRAVAMSSEGRRLAACANGGNIYVSADYGTNWTPVGSVRSWAKLVCSADGTQLFAYDGSDFFCSTDAGASWIQYGGVANVTDIATSADCSNIAITVAGMTIYTSSNFGLFWTPHEGFRQWSAIAISADGSRLAAGVAGGYIYRSNDYGATWTQEPVSSLNWKAITSAADGIRISACVQTTGTVYNYGLQKANWDMFLTSLTGAQNSSIELQYVLFPNFIPRGFMPLKHEGTFTTP